MKSYSLSQVDDHILLRDLATLVSQDRATNAALLAHLAEVEERKLYAWAAYSSMHLYCVRELRMSEDVAYARIRAERKAREFPAIFPALSDGRLNVTAVLLIAGHLTSETADELLTAAAHKTSAEIRLLLAERFPQPDVPTLIQAVAAPGATGKPAPEPVEAGVQLGLDPVETAGVQVAVQPPVPTTRNSS